MTGPNTGLGHNSMVYMIESQLTYVMGAMRAMRTHGARTLEVRAQAVKQYGEQLEKAMDGTVWTAGHCASWYLDETGRNTTLWPSFSYKFRRQTEEFDEASYEVAA